MSTAPATMHFRFEALPTELQLRILSFTSLVTDSPARDLTNFQEVLNRAGGYTCCGCCEGPVAPGMRCTCFSGNRLEARTSCECLVFAQPLLAVNRNIRQLSLEHIYKHALFEIGPAAANGYNGLIDDLRCISPVHLAKVSRLRILIELDYDPLVELEALRNTKLWRSVLEFLRDNCLRHAVTINLLFVCLGRRSDEIVDMVEYIRDSLNITNVVIDRCDEDWLEDRYDGRVV